MSSRRGNPFEELERLFERMSRQLEGASSPWGVGTPREQWSGDVEEMAVDLVEHDEEFVVTVDLPGFEKDEVDVRVTDHTLRVEADHEEATEEREEQYLRHERRHESMRRTIQIPDDVDADGVSARMNNGVLTVRLPKLEIEEARSIDIE